MNAKEGLYFYENHYPKLADSVFVAPGAKIIGQVSIAEYANVWYNAVIRGDVNWISIGKYTNIQDSAVVHVIHEWPTVIGSYVTVGHGAILHNCEIADHCLIGMGAIILGQASIGENTVIGAGTLIPENKKIPPNSLVIGSPGKVIRQLTEEERKNVLANTEDYAWEAQKYLKGFNLRG